MTREESAASSTITVFTRHSDGVHREMIRSGSAAIAANRCTSMNTARWCTSLPGPVPGSGWSGFKRNQTFLWNFSDTKRPNPSSKFSPRKGPHPVDSKVGAFVSLTRRPIRGRHLPQSGTPLPAGDVKVAPGPVSVAPGAGNLHAAGAEWCMSLLRPRCRCSPRPPRLP